MTEGKAKAGKEGVLQFGAWRAVVSSDADGWALTLNGQPAGNFTTSAAAAKFARDTARRKFGNSRPDEDTLVRLSRSREGVLVPLCYNVVYEGDGRTVGGKGLAECDGCPYRTTCSPEEVLDAEAPMAVPKIVEAEEDLIARLQAKLGGKQ